MAQTQGRRSLNRRKRKRKVFKLIFFLGLFSFLALGGLATYFTLKVTSVASESQQDLSRGEKSELRVEAVDPSKDNISILLLGEDKRPEDGVRARTDAIVVATFNKEEHSVILTSIPRDTRVNIVGRDIQDKINHAHAYGGVDMTVDTVEEFLDIPIDYYAKVNFDAFIEVVDALGGVEIEVPFDFQEKDTVGDWIDFYEGPQFLMGEEALAYVRMRRHPQSGGDIGRGQRQQQVLEAIIKKGASFSSITRFDDVIVALGDNLTMNLSIGNVVALHSYGSSLNSIEQLQISGENARINGVFYIEPDEQSVEEISTRLRQHLGLEESSFNTTGFDSNSEESTQINTNN
ncbi:LCP family protein [Alkalihalophilus marmarensis]|uniref:LCP family protein n=1 Tax=Alkalihalophilus marmarensis TaxID=521377 RepID=UPI002E217C42|nr:LCP family protein [Alkalihalophilus marmarensis]